MFYSAKYINLDFIHNPAPEPGLYTYSNWPSGFLLYAISKSCKPEIHWFSTFSMFRDSNIFSGEALAEITIEYYIRYSCIFIERYRSSIKYYNDNKLIW